MPPYDLLRHIIIITPHRMNVNFKIGIYNYNILNQQWISEKNIRNFLEFERFMTEDSM